MPSRIDSFMGWWMVVVMGGWWWFVVVQDMAYAAYSIT